MHTLDHESHYCGCLRGSRLPYGRFLSGFDELKQIGLKQIMHLSFHQDCTRNVPITFTLTELQTFNSVRNKMVGVRETSYL